MTFATKQKNISQTHRTFFVVELFVENTEPWSLFLNLLSYLRMLNFANVSIIMMMLSWGFCFVFHFFVWWNICERHNFFSGKEGGRQKYKTQACSIEQFQFFLTFVFFLLHPTFPLNCEGEREGCGGWVRVKRIERECFFLWKCSTGQEAIALILVILSLKNHEQIFFLVYFSFSSNFSFFFLIFEPRNIINNKSGMRTNLCVCYVARNYATNLSLFSFTLTFANQWFQIEPIMMGLKAQAKSYTNNISFSLFKLFFYYWACFERNSQTNNLINDHE